MGRIEIAEALLVLVGDALGLCAAFGDVVVGGGAGIVHPAVDGLAEGVSGGPGQAAAPGALQCELGSIQVGSAAVDDPFHVVIARVGTAAVHGGGGEGNAIHRYGAVQREAVEQLEGAAAHVAEARQIGTGKAPLDAEIILVDIGRNQVRREPGGRGPQVGVGQVEPAKWLKQVRVLHLDITCIGRVIAHLLVGNRQDLAEGDGIAGAQHPFARTAPGDGEARAEVIAIAAIGDAVQAVDFIGRGFPGCSAARSRSGAAAKPSTGPRKTGWLPSCGSRAPWGLR